MSKSTNRKRPYRYLRDYAMFKVLQSCGFDSNTAMHMLIDAEVGSYPRDSKCTNVGGYCLWSDTEHYSKWVTARRAQASRGGSL